MVGVDFLGADEGSFWSGMQSSVQFWHDIFNGTIIKSIVFALICTWVAVYQGYACDPTPEGIATAMTRTVVYSSLCVLGFDFVDCGHVRRDLMKSRTSVSSAVGIFVIIFGIALFFLAMKVSGLVGTNLRDSLQHDSAV